VRVIAGAAKGRQLKLDRRSSVRPTSDKLREALFSTLGSSVRERRVLDLYAGTGALGIEALSRGAASATFVDSDRSAIGMIRANLEFTGLSERAEVVHRTAERFVAGGGGPFDLILMDPPYAAGIPYGVLKGLLHHEMLASDATLVLEVSSRLSEPEIPAGYRVEQHRRYGDSALLYLASS
jgi:16S rRNA (guanine966-N2)-methyltransferase